MAKPTALVTNALDLFTLKTIAPIARRIQQVSQEAFQIQPASLCPRPLEQQAWMLSTAINILVQEA
jgi:hypothetical protein